MPFEYTHQNMVWLKMIDRKNTSNLILFYFVIPFVLWSHNPAFATWSNTSVGQETNEVGIEVELEVMTKLETSKFIVFQNDDCNDNYVGHVSKEAGKIQLISSTQENWYVIRSDDDTQRFLPENLPEKFKKDGLKVIFSGKICEIPENVRLIGTPLILTEIEEVKTIAPDM